MMVSKKYIHPARWLFALSILLLVCSLLIRARIWFWQTSDMGDYLQWYDIIHANGIGAVLKNAGSYSPAMLYLIALASKLPVTAGHSAIKFVLLCFDALSAFLVYRIARLKYPVVHISLAWAALYFIMPTILMNSSGWGQMDSVYSTFLLTSLFFLLVERPALAVLCFSMAFAFKAQAIFLLPFLGVLMLKRKVPWWYFGLVPVVYLIFSLPVISNLESWIGSFRVYQAQSTVFRVLSMNAPNPYIFFNWVDYDVGLLVGLGIALVVMAAWVIFSSRTGVILDRRVLSLLAVISVGLVPYLLPKMHDRYFYPADMFSLVLAIFMPELWYVPLGYQVISGLSYGVYLFNAPVVVVKVAAILNTLVIGILVWKGIKVLRGPTIQR